MGDGVIVVAVVLIYQTRLSGYLNSDIMKQTKTRKKSFDLFSQENPNWGAGEGRKFSELAQTHDEYKFTAFLTSKLTSPLLSQFKWEKIHLNMDIVTENIKIESKIILSESMESLRFLSLSQIGSLLLIFFNFVICSVILGVN